MEGISGGCETGDGIEVGRDEGWAGISVEGGIYTLRHAPMSQF